VIEYQLQETQFSKRSSKMAKTITCRDVGVDCDFQATGETVDDVLRQCADHAKSAHGMQEIPPELAAKVQSAIRES
jgi:predicted small metal-binding protein